MANRDRPAEANREWKPCQAFTATGSEQLITARKEDRSKDWSGSMCTRSARKWKAKLGSHVRVARSSVIAVKSRSGDRTQSNGDIIQNGVAVARGMTRQAISPMSW